MEVEPIRKLSDVKRMYNHLLSKGINREAECFLIGCNVALRAGDLLTIRFDQIEKGQKKVIINEQKTGKKREFPITQVVRESVARLREYYETPRSHGNKDIDPTYLFQSTSHRAASLCQPICIQWLGQAIKKSSAGCRSSHTEEGFMREFCLLKVDRTPNKRGRKFLCSMLYTHSNKRPEYFHLMEKYRQ